MASADAYRHFFFKITAIHSEILENLPGFLDSDRFRVEFFKEIWLDLFPGFLFTMNFSPESLATFLSEVLLRFLQEIFVRFLPGFIPRFFQEFSPQELSSGFLPEFLQKLSLGLSLLPGFLQEFFKDS